MSTFLIVVAVIVGVALFAAGVRELTVLKLPDDDAAFTGSVQLCDLTPKRVAEIGPLVDRISVITVDIGRNTRSPPINADAYEVFIIDVNGAFHDISRFTGAKEAAETAHRAAELLDAPVDDPYGLLPDV